MAKLYELTSELEAILAAADAETGELPADLSARLDALGLALDAKADQCCRLIRQEQTDAAGYESESRRLGDLAKAAWGRADRVKTYVRDCLDRAGMKRLDTPLFKLTVCANGTPSVRLEDGAAVPECYRRVKVELDAKAAADDWRAGKPLPPSLTVEVGSHLRIDPLMDALVAQKSSEPPRPLPADGAGGDGASAQPAAVPLVDGDGSEVACGIHHQTDSESGADVRGLSCEYCPRDGGGCGVCRGAA